MSKGQTKKTREAAGNRRKLTRAEKKQIAEAIRKAKGDGKARTAQQTIPYLAMYPDGICKVTEKRYSKCVVFEDINYQLAQADDKTAIFENWCDFLNYFDASVSVQLSFINQGTQREQAEKAITIPAQEDAFNSIRTEYSDMLKNQLSKGNNGLVKHKYITFTVEADNKAAAKSRLSRIETDVLNNFKVLSIMDTRFDEHFGFTDSEVMRLLADYNLSDHFDVTKSWYDGYRFGNADVYCPWDVLNYGNRLQTTGSDVPVSFWKNTSDNAIIRSFIDYAGSNITRKMETLLSGGYIVQQIEENLTYDYLHSSEENLWSILYLTGYLTTAQKEGCKENLKDGEYALQIPNAEVMEIFESTIKKWFDDTAKLENRQKLFDAVWNGNDELLTNEMTRLLRTTISYHDYGEDFYHAFLAGIFAGAGYPVESNKEHGEGRSDVIVYNPREAKVAVFEAKYAKKLCDMDKACDMALLQINERMYAEEFADDYDEILCYGISFFRKRCRVRKR